MTKSALLRHSTSTHFYCRCNFDVTKVKLFLQLRKSAMVRFSLDYYLKFYLSHALSECLLLPIFLITTIQIGVPFGIKRWSCARSRGFPVMTAANENDWQLKYDRLVLWQNATWRRTDKLVLKPFRQELSSQRYNLPL